VVARLTSARVISVTCGHELPLTVASPKLANCTNAIAKGFIVDLASEAAWRLCELGSLTVSAGGRIAHRGPVPMEIGIDDPTNTLDNSPPPLTIELRDAAVATSGSARRGFPVGGEWISHVLDPRTGYSADASASATVIAANSATADVVATIVNVMEPTEGLAFVYRLDADGLIECWITGQDGTVRHTGADR